jgi:hypothetical protein
VTIVSEDSPFCGQSGRVRRVFWRERSPWVLVRLRIGGITSIRWAWTDLPVPESGGCLSADEEPTVLFSPTALRDLVRFLRSQRTKPNRKKHSND